MKDLQGAPLQPGAPVKREHQVRHQLRAQRQPAMLLLVAAEVPGAKAVRQHKRLAKGKTETFSRDRIYGAGCIPDQSDIPATDPLQRAGRGNGALLSRSDGCIGQTSPEFREASQRFV